MTKKAMRGPVSLFRGKVRAPVTLTLTPKHHRQLDAAVQRLGVTRADVIALLVEKHADDLTPDDVREQLEGDAPGSADGSR